MASPTSTATTPHASDSPHASASGGDHGGQQHSVGLYLKVWGLLFVLSTFSYLVDYANLHGYLRWGLILALMVAKAGLIVAVFMHMRWERLALVYAILIPPLALLVLMSLMAAEADYTFLTRLTHFH